MTRPSPASTPEDLFEAIATLLEPGQREYFYQRMLYFRHLRPEDELLRLVEAIGLLALRIREAPQAVAREREQMAQLLESEFESRRPRHFLQVRPIFGRVSLRGNGPPYPTHRPQRPPGAVRWIVVRAW